jgi:hypothetical protein
MTSPTVCRSGRRCLRKLLAVTMLGLAACGGPETPEGEIRAFVDEAEALAEARDAPALRGLVADDYRDERGRDASEIRNFLHAWLVAHPSVNLLTRIDSIELEGTEQARVQVTVGMLGREARGESDWELAADIERLEVLLAHEGSGWRVIGAGRQDER